MISPQPTNGCIMRSPARGMVNLAEEELPALVALAELRRRQGDVKAAREFLDDVWEMAERGPYPLFHADACNVLAQIERDEGNHAAAVEAATKAIDWRGAMGRRSLITGDWKRRGSIFKSLARLNRRCRLLMNRNLSRCRK